MKDELTSLLGLRIKPAILLFSMCMGFTFGIAEFVTAWVWNPAALYFTISAMVVADTVTGMIIALRKKNFETRKALRGFYKWLAYTVVLAITNQLIKHDTYLIILREVVFIPMVLVLLASVIKNLTLLGYLNKGLGKWIGNNIDLYKNPTQFGSNYNPNPTADTPPPPNS